jgi:hypothetical protein
MLIFLSDNFEASITSSTCTPSSPESYISTSVTLPTHSTRSLGSESSPGTSTTVYPPTRARAATDMLALLCRRTSTPSSTTSSLLTPTKSSKSVISTDADSSLALGSLGADGTDTPGDCATTSSSRLQVTTSMLALLRRRTTSSVSIAQFTASTVSSTISTMGSSASAQDLSYTTTVDTSPIRTSPALNALPDITIPTTIAIANTTSPAAPPPLSIIVGRYLAVLASRAG